MAPNNHLLENICSDQETLNQAQIIFRLAQKKTGPGTGYELGPHTTGLPAICAYIASHKLNNGQVSRKTAQIASCLRASDFEKALQNVQAALGDTRKELGVNQVYDNLIRKYQPLVDRSLLLGWLKIADQTLLQGDSDLNPNDPVAGSDVKHAAFFWVYNISTGKTLTTLRDYAEDNDVPLKSLSKLLKEVTTCCSSLGPRIQREVLERGGSPTKATTTPRRTPKKPILRTLPSRDSPSKRKAERSYSDFDQAISDVDALDTLMPETPTKKRKSESQPKPTQSTSANKPIVPPVTPLPRLALDFRVGKKKEIVATQKDVTNTSRVRVETHDENSMDVDNDPTLSSHSDSDEGDDGRPAQRRFHPVFMDHKQWYSTDKRLKRIWKQVEMHKRNM